MSFSATNSASFDGNFLFIFHCLYFILLFHIPPGTVIEIIISAGTFPLIMNLFRRVLQASHMVGYFLFLLLGFLHNGQG